MMGRTCLSVRALIAAAVAFPIACGCAEEGETPAVGSSASGSATAAAPRPEDDGVPAQVQSPQDRAEAPTGRREPDFHVEDPPKRSGEPLDENAALAAVRAQPEVMEWLGQFEGEPGYRSRLVVTDRDARMYHVRVEVHRTSPEAGAKANSALWYEVDRETGEVTKIEL